MDFVLTAVLCVVAAALLAILTRKPKNFPPGPRRWPLIGSLPAMMPSKAEEAASDTLSRLRKEYGNLIGVYFGPHPGVIVSGFEAVKMLSMAEEFSYRPNLIATQHGKQGGEKKIGLIFVEGARWKSQRRFTLRHLRDFGFGRQGMEVYIHEEVRLLLSTIDKMLERQDQSGLDILPLLPVAAINTLWSIVAGVRHDLDDANFVKLTKAVLRFFRLSELVSPVGFYRFLQYVPVINKSFVDQRDCGDQLWEFVQGAVKEHIRTYDEAHLRDFIDVYIKEMKETPTEHFSEEQLVAACVDLFLAGTETSSGGLSFILRYMLWYPEVQEKVRKEIFSVVGQERLPSMDDISHLPYCSAVLTESLRHSGLTPVSPPRSNAEEVDFLGYRIPKRSFIIMNMRSVHMDPEHWGDPENFRPDRFMDADGNFQKDEHLLLFGTGTRMCLGEPFARNSAFLLFVSIIQNYKLEVPEDGKAPVDVTLAGVTAAPQHFNVKFTRL